MQVFYNQREDRGRHLSGLGLEIWFSRGPFQVQLGKILGPEIVTLTQRCCKELTPFRPGAKPGFPERAAGHLSPASPPLSILSPLAADELACRPAGLRSSNIVL